MLTTALVTPAQREPLVSMNHSTSRVSVLCMSLVDTVRVRQIISSHSLTNIFMYEKKNISQIFNFNSSNSLFLVSNCGGQLLATPLTQYMALPSRFPDYGLSCTWNISAENQLSRLNITIDDNTPPYQRGPNCGSLQVKMFAGEV